ncbi:MAG: phospholipase D family protein [Treponema sp.]|jgi:phosphatidylserine/phosphatidylglycerophosphate/cardiolipin synthase-like enzyme|nr:phospholipase D family protein [Treponema sp.]
MYNIFIKPFLLLALALSALSCDTGTGSAVSSREMEDVQVYFSPQDDCAGKAAALIDAASKSVNIALYSFNLQPIADAAIAAHKRGVAVRVVCDADQAAANNSQAAYLEAAQIPVRRDKHPGYGSMHHKFAVIDGMIVITGSYNWTANASKNNDENMVVIRSSATAQAYTQEFERIWDHAEQKQGAADTAV